MQRELRIEFFLVVLVILALGSIASAEVFNSANFKVLDPVLFPAGFSSSTSFQLHGTISQIGIGTSTATSFNISSGFLFYPFVNLPMITATVGDAEISLSWTTSTGALGWTVSGYNVGQSTTAGGPYTYTSLGNVTSSTRTGLTNGTEYFFVIRPEDAFGNSIASSTEVSATPVAAAPAPPPPAPAGGGVLLSLLQTFRPFPPRVPFIPSILCAPITDLNCDGKINLQDLSIFLFLEPKPIPNPADFNKDETVDTKDLSVLFFNWTDQFFTFAQEETEGQTYRSFEGGRRTSLFEESEEQVASVGQTAVFKEPAAISEEKVPPIGIIRRIGQFILTTVEKVIRFFRP